MELFLTLVGGAFILGIVGDGPAQHQGARHPGRPRGRQPDAPADRGPAGGWYLDRREIPWPQRPAQYGVVEGELDGLAYQLLLMPWNAEDCGGAAMLSIAAAPGKPVSPDTGHVVFTPSETFHWPDRADPGVLASYVRAAIATTTAGGRPPSLP